MPSSSSSQDKVTAEWDAMAGEWDDMAGGYRDGFVKLFWEETGYANDESSKQDLVVVDFGCATGLLTEVIRKTVARVVAIDVAPSMIQVLKDKIRAGDWNNVDAFCGVVGQLELNKADDVDLKSVVQELQGKVDIVAASSVLSFIPEEDMETTMKILASLLKPESGVLCHTDWPKGEQYPDGFDEAKAIDVYQKGGLQAKTTKTISMKIGPQEMKVF